MAQASGPWRTRCLIMMLRELSLRLPHRDESEPPTEAAAVHELRRPGSARPGRTPHAARVRHRVGLRGLQTRL
eukprot:250539-Rhodomonas_salina.1